MRDIGSKSKIVKEIQEKSTLVLLPVAFLILFGAKPLVTLWIGDNISLIATTLVVVTIGSLLSFLVFGAMNHFLGVDKPIVLFISSTVSNIIYSGVILLLHKPIGYSSVYWCFFFAYLANIFIMLYYQKRLLNTLIFDTRHQIVRLLIYVIITFIIGWSLTMVISNPFILLAALGIIIPSTSLFLYIILSLINEYDIKRYFGENFIAKIFNLLFRKFNRFIVVKENIIDKGQLL
jgi:O-antigen/teichoic acid export membrane protein